MVSYKALNTKTNLLKKEERTLRRALRFGF